ncbi:hypothetical protein FBZ85_106170 [Azospirillum brasilense]|uniref:Uncharacterized protein n=1 Tax=Azospirillum baldaniorum TaxID=1064539 RepID=A0A9P1JZN7_9PROT|nr:hypothetical protein [Azospirillum baldaniorum]TWA71906.1 hypothetical protein FBZ84_101172 [Azospirillum baldaniorum]TWA78010.1 hypothetical protein FBZ85_106170 [Azospirillum brasilense]CCD02888.1 protein of unknown function [Azospirillum baldaniorum]
MEALIERAVILVTGAVVVVWLLVLGGGLSCGERRPLPPPRPPKD